MDGWMGEAFIQSEEIREFQNIPSGARGVARALQSMYTLVEVLHDLVGTGITTDVILWSSWEHPLLALFYIWAGLLAVCLVRICE